MCMYRKNVTEFSAIIREERKSLGKGLAVDIRTVDQFGRGHTVLVFL